LFLGDASKENQNGGRPFGEKRGAHGVGGKERMVSGLGGSKKGNYPKGKKKGYTGEKKKMKSATSHGKKTNGRGGHARPSSHFFARRGRTWEKKRDGKGSNEGKGFR